MPQGNIKKTDPDKRLRRVLGATTLAGDSVRNTADENLGKVKEIMIDVPSGRIAYAVLSFGGVLNMGNKLFAVPWNTLRLEVPLPNAPCFVDASIAIRHVVIESAIGIEMLARPF